MFPLIRNDDYIVLRAVTKLDSLKPGDVILFKHSDFGNIVKIIDYVDSKIVRVKGLSRLSVDTSNVGDISKTDIHYLVIAIISQFRKTLLGIGSFRILTRSGVLRLLSKIC